MMALLQSRGGSVHNKRANNKNLKKALDQFLDSKSLQAAGCVVLDDDSRILLGKRLDNGLWANPGGHVDDGETYEDAALRELREETGLVGKNAEELFSGRYNGYEGKSFLVTGFKGKLKGNGEMADLKWFHPSDLPWDYMTAYAKDAIKALITKKLQKSNDI